MHAEGQFLLWVLVQLLPHSERFGDHFALLDPLGLVVTATNDPGAETNIHVGEKKQRDSISHSVR